MSRPIAIIPARGGSSRVKNKNLQIVGNTSLVMHAVNVAKESECFSEIIVSTEDPRIEKEVGSSAIVDRRPHRLANDTASVLQVLTELITRLEIDDKDVGIMLPTCVLRNADDIRGAFRLYKKDGGVPVVSVASFEAPVHLAFALSNDGRLLPMFPDDYCRSTRSIDHPKAVRYNGAIIFNCARNFFSQRTLVGEKAAAYEMPPERSIDIDWLYQLEMAKALVQI